MIADRERVGLVHEDLEDKCSKPWIWEGSRVKMRLGVHPGF